MGRGGVALSGTLLSKINGPPRLLIFQKISHPPAPYFGPPRLFIFRKKIQQSQIFHSSVIRIIALLCETRLTDVKQPSFLFFIPLTHYKPL